MMGQFNARPLFDVAQVATTAFENFSNANLKMLNDVSNANLKMMNEISKSYIEVFKTCCKVTEQNVNDATAKKV